SSLSQVSANTLQSSPPPPPEPALQSSATSKATDTALQAHSNPHCPAVEQSAPSSLPPMERSSTPASTAPPRTQEYFPAPPSSPLAASALSSPTRPSSRRARPAATAPSPVHRTSPHTYAEQHRHS